MKNRKKLIIIDAYALIHRSFHALPLSLSTKDGLIVNAVYGLSSFILKAIKELKPDYIAFTLDSAGPTFRHKRYKEYKATREKAPDELYRQIPIIKDLIKNWGVSVFEKSGFEADDLIGTISQRAKDETELESIIITSDKDTLQLVDSRTSVYTMSRGLNDAILYKAETVKEKLGIHPDQVVDYKALRGDPSDNIPGVRGVGDKTAVKLLQEYKSLDNVYKAVEKDDKELKDRLKELLQNEKKEAYLSKELASIDRAIELEINWNELEFKLESLANLEKVFSELEFKSLLPKLKELGLDLAGQNNKKFSGKRAKKLSEQADFDKLLKELNKEKSLNLFLIDEPKHSILAFSAKQGQAYYILINRDRNLFSSDNNFQLKNLESIFADTTIQKQAFDLKALLKFLKKHGLELKGLDFDIKLANYLLDPGRLFEEKKEDLNFDDEDSLALFLGLQLDIIHNSSQELKERLKKKKLLNLYYDLELPLINVLAKMEEVGIALDLKNLKKLEISLKADLKKISKSIFDLSGEEFNLNSPKQLQEILFNKLKLNTKGIKKIKTGLSTADEELLKLAKYHEIIPLIQEYRELNKLLSTYVLALPKLVSPIDARIHTNYHQTVTATGRLSSSNPNLQNIPVVQDKNKNIRSAFVASAKKLFLSLDYSQIELRLAAHLSQDKKMLEAFLNKQDIHSTSAAAINQIPIEELKPEMRQAAKAVNFGILYGQGPHGLSQSAKISYAEAKDFISRYLEVYPGIKKMMDDFIKLAKKNSYTKTILGRIRPLPEINSNIIQLQKMSERMAINTPIQGSAADMIKKAMLEIDEYIKDSDEIKLILQVHDELIFEIDEDKVDKYKENLERIMIEAMPLSIPILVKSSVAKNWGDLN